MADLRLEPGGATEPEIDVTDLSVRFPGFQLGPLSLRLFAGERVALVGPNGAGKSTTMRVLAGRLDEYSGSVQMSGLEAREHGPDWRARVGFLPETLLGLGWMTVQQHLGFLARFFPGWDSSYADRLRERLSLSGMARVGTLSKGMRVKLSFIAAEAFRPRVLLLDEPTSGLDPIVRGELIATLQDIALRERQRLILFSTHILEDVEAIAERVILMKAGRITTNRSVPALKASGPGLVFSEILYNLLTANEPNTVRRVVDC